MNRNRCSHSPEYADVRLDEQFSMIQALKESYPVKTLCEAFGAHRSSYRLR